MKKSILSTEYQILTFLLLICSPNIHAQEAKHFTVEPGKSIIDVISPGDIFLYPQFIMGKSVYKSGFAVDQLLNYNVILGEMQFINPGKDTLVVANAGSIRYFVLAADTFYFNNGYYKIIKGNRDFKLLEKHYTRLDDVRKEAGYGTTSSTGAIDSYTTLFTGNNQGVYKLKANEKMEYSIRTDYYFENSEKEFVPAIKQNILKIFPDHAVKIKEYIKSQSIRFSKKEDLIKLTDFVMSL
jgi:hypothetical protein